MNQQQQPEQLQPAAGLTPITEDKFWNLYTRGKTLGKGSFGTVYEGICIETGVVTAVKVVYKSGNAAKDKVTFACVSREAECWLPLSHPNIVKLLNAYEMEMSWSFPMELMQGGDLLDKITRDEHYSEDVAKRFIRQLAEGIAHMHSHGIVHRDLKLENLMVSSKDDNCLVKLSDFDLACYCFDEVHLKEACGTPGYVAPEIILLAMGKPAPLVTTACDVWSFGVISYILLCGHPPFDMENDDVCARDTIAGNWYFPDDIWKDVSNGAKDVIKAMLQVDPTKRATINEVLSHPWFHSTGLNLVQTETRLRLKRFNARRKWKVAIKLVAAAAMFRSITNSKKVATKRPSETALRQLVNVAVQSQSQAQQQQQQQQEQLPPSNSVFPTTYKPLPVPPAKPNKQQQQQPKNPSPPPTGIPRRLSDLVENAPVLADAAHNRQMIEIEEDDEMFRMENEMKSLVLGFSISSLLKDSPLLTLEEKEKRKQRQKAWTKVHKPATPQKSKQTSSTTTPKQTSTAAATSTQLMTQRPSFAEQRIFSTTVEEDLLSIASGNCMTATLSLSNSFNGNTKKQTPQQQQQQRNITPPIKGSPALSSSSSSSPQSPLTPNGNGHQNPHGLGFFRQQRK